MLIDAHCHLDFPQLAASPQVLAATLTAANKAGVGSFLVAATQASSWQRLLALVASQPSCLASLGLHPWFIAQHRPEDLHQLESFLTVNKPNKIIALGELGLDFSTPELTSLASQQEEYFLAQVAIAQRLNLPLVLHHHQSLERILQLLKQANFSYGGLVHGFSGSDQQANEFLRLGFKLGVGLNLLFSRASRLQRQVASLPLTSWLLETDSPSLKAHPALSSAEKPVISTPAHLQLVAEKFSQLTGLSRAEIEKQTLANFLAAFPLAKASFG